MRPEDVVVRHPPALFGLDPFRPKAMLATPLLQHRAQPDDVQKGALAQHAPDHRAVIVVEVAVDRDATGFRKRDRFLDLTALEVLLAKRRRPGHLWVAGTGTRASAQIGRKEHRVHGRSACSGPSAKSPAMMRDVAE